MVNPILARSIFGLQERWLGRSTLRYAKELEWSQWESPDAIRELQRRKLRALLNHAANYTFFYRKRFQIAGFDVVADDPFDVLRSLPTLTKSEIRGSIDAMQWHDAPGGLFPHNTGGSTGEPLTFCVDRRRQAYDQAARIRTHRWFGVDIGERELYLWGSPIERDRTDRLKSFRDRLCNQKLLDAFQMSPARMDAYWNAYERFRPRCVFGYPSSIALFVRHAISQNHKHRSNALKAVFVTGEVCYPHDRKLMEEFFNVLVADCYGSRDGGFIAHECPDKKMHITAENAIVEILNGNEPQPIGTEGEIVLTHLDAFGMPFIRYRTGDTGRLLSGRCSCGRGLPLMDVVQGRVTDLLRLPDGTFKHALSVIYPIRELSGVDQFRVTQSRDYNIAIDIVRNSQGLELTHARILQRVRPVFGNGLDIKINWVNSIESTASGKYCYVVSEAANNEDGGSTVGR
ncbi:MAG: phenylacetate--CoA ligase family protein [Planctomycetes bacterium]|nr:phenylacetate--CoA ligase family protein [Planctomycetota bacterium]MBI3835473.1 phenylacetate--CoA ligase family protein [Planctomycetota bacterium]